MPVAPTPFFVAGRPLSSPGQLLIIDKYQGTAAGVISVPGAEDVDRAINAAVDAVEPMRALPAFQRHDALARVAARLKERAEQLAATITAETGKPIQDARAEVTRAIDTFHAAAVESTRLTGEYIPLDASPRGTNTQAITRQDPIGVCSFITPFNFPLNLAAHKVAPAIAVGCPFVLKPDPRAPLSALMLGELLSETELPEGAFSVLPVTDEPARDMFVTDPRLKLISFTGSSEVGWSIKRRAGRAKVLLELGGNAACIVDAISKAEVDRVAERLCFGAFALAGQSCVSVQRVFIHRLVYDSVVEGLAGRANALARGDPRLETTRVGPMFSIEAAQRVEQWVEEAVRGGARIVTGGRRSGSLYEPTILEHVPTNAKVSCEEVFGPVVVVQGFDSFEEALRLTNESRYGLQAGLFTNDLRHAHRAWNVLDVGAVIVNDVPTMRVDVMPYGGVKESGVGREGVRYAMHEMTELRTMVLRDVGRA